MVEVEDYVFNDHILGPPAVELGSHGGQTGVNQVQVGSASFARRDRNHVFCTVSFGDYGSHKLHDKYVADSPHALCPDSVHSCLVEAATVLTPLSWAERRMLLAGLSSGSGTVWCCF